MYLACCLLKLSEGSLFQLTLKTGVELEGWGSLWSLEEVKKTCLVAFHMLTCCHYYTVKYERN